MIAESFERIHRSNLVGMGVAPLEFLPGENAESLGLTGREVFDIDGLAEGVASGFAGGREVTVRATARRRQGHRVQGPGAPRHPAGGRSTTATAASCTTCCGSSLQGTAAQKSPAPWREPARGEERELKEIVGASHSGTGSTPATRLML